MVETFTSTQMEMSCEINRHILENEESWISGFGTHSNPAKLLETKIALSVQNRQGNCKKKSLSMHRQEIRYYKSHRLR